MSMKIDIKSADCKNEIRPNPDDEILTVGFVRDVLLAFERDCPSQMTRKELREWIDKILKNNLGL